MKATMRHRGSNVEFLRNGTPRRWPWKVILMVAEAARPIAFREENIELALVITGESVPNRDAEHCEA